MFLTHGHSVGWGLAVFFDWFSINWIIPLGLLIASGLRLYHVRQQTPEQRLKTVRVSQNGGTIFPPLPVASYHEAIEYAVPNIPPARVLLNTRGVSATVFGWELMSPFPEPRFNQFMHNHKGGSEELLTYPWNEILEWEMLDFNRYGSTRSKRYLFRFIFRDGQMMYLNAPLTPAAWRRTVDTATLLRILDYVRSVGQCPVRLHNSLE